MNVLFVIDCLGPGGAQRQLVLLANSLRRQGHTVYVAVYYRVPDEIVDYLDEDIPIARKLGSPKTLSVARWIKQEQRRCKIDATVSFLPGANRRCMLAALASRRSPTIISERGERSASPSGRIALRIDSVLYRRASFVVVNSTPLSATWSQLLRSRGRNQVRLVRNGVVMGETPQARPPREAPESATISMVSVGSVLQSKGPQVLAQALQIASARTTSRLCLTWFGKVYERLDASLQAVAAVERLVADSGGSFEWIWAGHVGDVRDHLSAYDFLVHPSLSEGFPNAICEALAAGLPVVATDVGDARYLVTSSGAGIVVEPGSPELLADAILQASQCGVECLADMGLKGADYARNRLSIERMSHEFERLIDEASRS